MHQRDPIYHDGQVIGTAYIEKQGLYYKFKCVCQPKKPGLYAIYASNGNEKLKLGICVPEGENFVLTTRIPIKYFDTDAITFTAVNKITDENRILIDENKPFPVIEKLDKATYFYERGVGSIILHQDAHCQEAKDSVHP